MLVALGALASANSKVTEDTKETVARSLDYCSTNPDSKLIFHSRSMIFRIYSDASYLSELHARSRARGYFSDYPRILTTPDNPMRQSLHSPNIMKNVM